MSQFPVTSLASDIIRYVRGATRLAAMPQAAALQDEQMYVALHDINEEFCNYPASIGMFPFKFLRKEYPFQTKEATTLAVASAEDATSITLTDASDYDSPADTTIGAGWIKKSDYAFDFFSFTTKASNVLSQVSGLNLAHDALEETEKLYKLPLDYGKPRRLFVERTPYEFVNLDFTQIPDPFYYTTTFFENDDKSRSFIVMPEDIGEHDCVFYYFKRPNTIVNTDATCKVDAPNGTARRYIIERMKAYVWNHRGEPDMEAIADKAANKFMAMFMDEQSQQTAAPEQDPSFDM